MDNTEELEPKTELEKNIENNESDINKSNNNVLSKTEDNIVETDKSNSVEKNHEHIYVPVTTIVHHSAQTHDEDQGSYITVVDQEAYDSEEPVMEHDTYCLICYYRDGSIVRLHGQTEINNHILWHYNSDGGGCQYESQSLQTSVKVAHHDAIPHQEWQSNIVTVTDKPAYNEEIITDYVCSECGATK